MLGAATQLAANAIPFAARMAYFGDGTHRPGSGLETGMADALIPGRW